MKRYLLFGYSTYCPAGGWSDYLESFDNLEDAMKYLQEIKIKHWHYNAQIVDSESMKIIKEMYRSDGMGEFVISDPDSDDND